MLNVFTQQDLTGISSDVAMEVLPFRGYFYLFVMMSIIAVRKEDHFSYKKASCLKLLRALSNKRRLAILLYLQRNRWACVEVLANYLGVSEASASRHLRILRSSFLIDRQKSGSFVQHRLVPVLPKIARQVMREHDNNLTKLFNNRR